MREVKQMNNRSFPRDMAVKSLVWVKVFVVAFLLLTFLLVASRVSGVIPLEAAVGAAHIK